MRGIFVEYSMASALKEALKRGGFVEEFRVLQYSLAVGETSRPGCLIPVGDKILESLHLKESLIGAAVCTASSSLRELTGLDEVVLVEAEFPKLKGKNSGPIDSLNAKLAPLGLEADFDKYEHYGGVLLVLPETAFTSQKWSCSVLDRSVLMLVAAELSCKVIMRKQRISTNDLRLPRHELLFFDGRLPQDVSGEELDNFFVSTVQNGICYSWNPTRTMFSAGNISEKIRMSKLQCEGETVLDLYAGIGYWVLPLLVHGSAKKVIACDMNTFSIAALRRNFALNSVDPSKFTVLEGDHAGFVNEYENKADRVILGLIPTSERGWRFAVCGLSPKGGFLHVHENVDAGILESKKAEIKSRLESLCESCKGGQWKCSILHVQNVKSYGPKVLHYVFDVELRPV